MHHHTDPKNMQVKHLVNRCIEQHTNMQIKHPFTNLFCTFSLFACFQGQKTTYMCLFSLIKKIAYLCKVRYFLFPSGIKKKKKKAHTLSSRTCNTFVLRPTSVLALTQDSIITIRQEEQTEGFQPQWCISTIYHAWDTPFWSGTLKMLKQSIFTILAGLLHIGLPYKINHHEHLSCFMQLYSTINCTSSTFPMTLWPWVNIKVFQTRITL